MKLKITYLFTFLALTAIACDGSGDGEVQQEAIRKVNVRSQTVKAGEFNSFVRVVGNVETSDDIQISSEVNGRLLSYRVAEGQFVRKGEVIAVIDDAKLKQQKAQLQAATNQARENYERLKRIFEEDNVGSEINYLNAKYAYEQAAAQLESINVDLENTRVKAPFQGRVERYLVNEGEMATAGMPLLRFIGSEKYVVAAGVPARYANVIRSGAVAEIWFDEQDPDTLQGIVTYVGRSINQQNRTFRIEVQLPEKEYSYKVDMVANIRLSTLSESNVIVLSEEFIYRKNDDYVVYTVAEDEQGNSIAEERFIELGPSYQTNVIIRTGLKPGDELITTGSAFLNNGMRIQVFKDEDQPIASQ